MAIKASEQITLVDISDAYSVILTSEAYTFIGNTSGAPSGATCTTQAVAYCGVTQCTKVSITAANIKCPTGISAAVSNNGTVAPTITFKTTAVISSACEATIPVVVDGVTINKRFSFSVAKTGATGSAGKGIKSTTITYQAGATGTSAPTETWVSSPPATSTDKPYLWTKTVITYTDNTTSTSYSVGVPPNSIVSKGDVVNQVNAELKMDGTSMALKAGHFTVESDGLNIDKDGNAEFKGTVKASSGEFTKGFYVDVPVPMTTGGDALYKVKIDSDVASILFERNSEDAQAVINNVLKLTKDGIDLMASVGARSGDVNVHANGSMTFVTNGYVTDAFMFRGGNMVVNGLLKALASLAVQNVIDVKPTSGDGGLKLFADSEGGNVRIIGPSGKHFWEMDSYQNTYLRLFHYNGSSHDRFYKFSDDGTISGFRWLQTDASSLESGVKWTGVKSSKGSGNVIISCKPSGNYSQFLAYDNCNDNYIWYYNLNEKRQYYAVPLYVLNGLYIGSNGANITVGNAQTLYLGASSDANYKIFLGVRNSAWRFAPNVNAKLDLGEPNFRWVQLYVNSSAISTSDRNMKKNIRGLFDDERYIKFFKKIIPVSFKMKDGKSGRTHVGFISQDIEKAMMECELTSLDFAGFCKDQKCRTVVKTRVDINENGVEKLVEYEDTEPIEGEYIYSLRYEEFIALNTAMIQFLDRKVEILETRLSKLEDQIKKLIND